MILLVVDELPELGSGARREACLGRVSAWQRKLDSGRRGRKRDRRRKRDRKRGESNGERQTHSAPGSHVAAENWGRAAPSNRPFDQVALRASLS